MSHQAVGGNELPLPKTSHRILSFTQHLYSISHVPDTFLLSHQFYEIELFINHLIQMVKLRLSSLLTRTRGVWFLSLVPGGRVVESVYYGTSKWDISDWLDTKPET